MASLTKIILFSSISVTLLAAPAFAQAKEGRMSACKADREKFCADVPKGQHKIRPCLEANKDKLSPECKAALEAPRSEKNQQ